MILALDLGSSVGVCYGAASRAAPPTCQTWKLPTGSKGIVGPYISMFERTLNAAIGALSPDIIVFEAPLIRIIRGPGGQAFADMFSARKLIGLAVSAERIAWEKEIRCMEAQPATLKKVMAGHGRADKAQMQAAATRRGFLSKNEHEADACAAWLHVVREHFADHAQRWGK